MVVPDLQTICKQRTQLSRDRQRKNGCQHSAASTSLGHFGCSCTTRAILTLLQWINESPLEPLDLLLAMYSGAAEFFGLTSCAAYIYCFQWYEVLGLWLMESEKGTTPQDH